jgi:hypothetical protein
MRAQCGTYKQMENLCLDHFKLLLGLFEQLKKALLFCLQLVHFGSQVTRLLMDGWMVEEEEGKCGARRSNKSHTNLLN